MLRELDAGTGVSTKFRIGPEAGDIAGQVERAFAKSLARLGVERFELLQLHNNILAEPSDKGVTPEQILGPGGVVEGLQRLRDKGLIKWLVITAIGDGPACCEVIGSGAIDTAQVYYNMFNPSSGFAAAKTDAKLHGSGHDFSGILNARAAADGGVIAIRTLAVGGAAFRPRPSGHRWHRVRVRRNMAIGRGLEIHRSRPAARRRKSQGTEIL